jgi:lipoprotein-anchoring transpeptidase ErfK/SrfK
MSTSNESLIRKARVAVKSGEKRLARKLLHQAIRQNVDDHVAWAWLAAATSSPEISLGYALRAEKLKPNDPLVLKVRRWAERRLRSAGETEDRKPQQKAEDSSRREAGWRSVAIRGGIVVALVFLLFFAGLYFWSNIDGLFRTNRESGDNVIAAAHNEKESEILEPPDDAAIQDLAKLKATSTPTPPRLLAKNIVTVNDETQAAGPRATWTTTPTPTDTPTPTPTYVPTFISPQNLQPASRPFGVGAGERWIDVDLSAQVLSAFDGNDLVYSSYISSGTWQHPTVTGQFRIWVRYRSQTMDGRRLGYDYYLENVPYVMYFYKDYALHGTYWHNNFGTPMSHGCVNMKTPDAEWLFNWSSLGTVVNVHY